MISTDEVLIERVAVARGRGEPLLDLAVESSRVALGSDRVALGSDRVALGSDRVALGSDRVALGSDRVALGSSKVALGSDRVALGSDRVDVGSDETLSDSNETLNDPIPIAAVVAATFSNPDRFPSLAVKVASALGLPSSTPAFDLQMACSAYPYALYLAGKLSADIGGNVLVIDGDVQSPLVDPSDHATGAIFSDACTASVVSVRGTSAARSHFDFLSRADGALECSAQGPIKMDGFAVFSFVATEVSKFIGAFLDGVVRESDFDPRALQFAPHQANPYMVRRLADALGLSGGLLTIPDEFKNPGSCSVPMALAMKGKPGRAVVAGFGAGLSASVGIVRLAEGAFRGKIE